MLEFAGSPLPRMSAPFLSLRYILAGSLTVSQLLTASAALAASGDTVSSASSSSIASDSSTSSAPSGTATLTVEQLTVNKMYGKWSLIGQNGTAREGLLQSETAQNLAAGSYTFLVDPPEGATSTLRLYRNNEIIKSVDRTQMAFPLENGDNLKIVIQQLFTRVGTVAVETDPPGASFKLSGPNDQRIEGVTPASFLSMPEGQYKVEFAPFPGCVKAPPMSLYLEKDKRVSFSMEISCDHADKLRSEQETFGDRFVTVTIDGQIVVFNDVPQEAWFAPYIFESVRKGILSGYRGDDGRPTGTFGPGNNVTVAELAKMAHTLMSIDVTKQGPPDNRRARDQWFSPFIASAEALGWTIYSDATIDPLREATRGEVLSTLLQALETPLQWQKGTTFRDVTLRTPFAAAIETAASIGLVSGKQDATGKDTGLFGPLDAINRAEIAKILDLAVEWKLKAK